LAHLFAAIGQELKDAQDSTGNSVAFLVTVEGSPRLLSPVLQDEIYQIGREILRNAFRHARAKRIELEIWYDDRLLRLRIRDDGTGIDPKLVEQAARSGHWGLPGIRERAKLIGAKLDLWSEAGAGTEYQLTISAATAYAKSSDGRARGLFRKTTRSDAD
jgi:signal transduction histidine kinase